MRMTARGAHLGSKSYVDILYSCGVRFWGVVGVSGNTYKGCGLLSHQTPAGKVGVAQLDARARALNAN